MSAWGDYQSVIQLSVALNSAYAALATYLGSDLRSEQQAIKDANAAVPNEKREDKRVALTDLHLLDGKLTHAAQRYETVIDNGIRPACLIASLLGIVLLVVSSVFYSATINATWQFICGALLLPFLVGVGFATALIIKIRVNFATNRRRLEAKLFQDT